MKFTVKVVPKAKIQKIILDKSGVVKCYLSSPAEDGKANKELVKTLAKKLGTTQRDVTIVQGLTSRTKILEICGFNCEQDLLKALGLQTQQLLF